MITSIFHGEITFLLAVSGGVTCQLDEPIHLMPWINQVIIMPYSIDNLKLFPLGSPQALVSIEFARVYGGVRGDQATQMEY